MNVDSTACTDTTRCDIGLRLSVVTSCSEILDMTTMRLVSIVCICALLPACSTALLSATTTNAEDFLPTGSTRGTVRTKLGDALSIEPIPESHSISHIKTYERNSHILVKRVVTRTANSYKDDWPVIAWSTRETYRFRGAIRGLHDAGESASLALMTAGVSELLAAPAAAAASREREYLITVWYDQSGSVVGFNWKVAPTVSKQ